MSIRDFVRVRSWARPFSHDDSTHVPIAQQQQVNVKVSTRGSLMGLGFRGGSKQRFQSFSRGLARMIFGPFRGSRIGLD
ncbi:MAG: hypothetical protein JWP25_6547 [Bradyrhizobium sp.]|nr:hypothetical protein [Bradyrhizobium sp.]